MISILSSGRRTHLLSVGAILSDPQQERRGGKSLVRTIVVRFLCRQAPDENSAKIPPNGRLPDAFPGAGAQEKVIAHIRQVFSTQMGFTDEELVPLIAGGHVYGRCHTDRSGFNGPWSNQPTKFTNTYCKRLLKDKWAPVSEKSAQGTGPGSKCPILPKGDGCQFVNKNGDGDLMMLYTDMAFVWEPNWKAMIELYAKELGKFRDDFGKAFKKLTELGVPACTGSKL